VIFADGVTNLTSSSELHTDFILPEGSGQVVLSREREGRSEVLDYLECRNLRADRSYGSWPDAQSFERQSFYYATPGAPNNRAAGPLAVFVNEWMADNVGSLRDPADGNFEDWFELFNPGPEAVDLGGYLLTDNLAEPSPTEVPDNGQYVVPARGFLLVWADGEPGQNSTNRSDLHVNFKLDKQQGDAIYLLSRDRTVIDAVVFGPQGADVSEGRFPDGASARFFMPIPTPKQANQVSNTPPVMNAIPDRMVHEGQTVQFTVSAADVETPASLLVFSLEPGAPAGAGINGSSGLFHWTATGIAVPSTNQVSIRVTDTGTPPLFDVRSTSITVLPLPTPEARLIDGILRLSFATLPGCRYQVQFKDALSDPDWQPYSAWLTGDGEVITIEDDFTARAQRYYRVAVE
jgi:hypothetical protein